MPIPDYQTIMLPILKFANDGKEHFNTETLEHINKLFNLTEEEKIETLPSGNETTIRNRVGWAITYLKKAGLLEPTKRSYFIITKIGLETLRKNPPKINIELLEQFPGFIEFRTSKKEEKTILVMETEKTPRELLEDGYQKIRKDTAEELLRNIKKCSPRFFEHLVMDLLKKMGYGGSVQDAAKVIGQSGDEGIDGVIKEDKLGLDVIYIQAKRWEATVGRPEIQKFVGALKGQRAKKGIFITTFNFSADAANYAKNIEDKVVLIDGKTLTELMIDYNVGVSKTDSYEIKNIDSDYFEE